MERLPNDPQPEHGGINRPEPLPPRGEGEPQPLIPIRCDNAALQDQLDDGLSRDFMAETTNVDRSVTCLRDGVEYDQLHPPQVPPSRVRRKRRISSAFPLGPRISGPLLR